MISLVRAFGGSFRRRVFDALEGTREARLLGEQFCWHPVLPDSAPPPRRAPRPDPPVVYPGFPGHALHENGLQIQEASVHWSAAKNKERFSSRGYTAYQPRINRGSTAHFVPPCVYMGFRLFVLLEKRSSDVSSNPSIPWKVQRTCVSCANSSVGTQSCPTPPGRPAGRRDPTRLWYVRVWDSTGWTRQVTNGPSPIVESKTRKYNGRVGSGRTAEWRGGVGQDWMPTELFA